MKIGSAIARGLLENLARWEAEERQREKVEDAGDPIERARRLDRARASTLLVLQGFLSVPAGRASPVELSCHCPAVLETTVDEERDAEVCSSCEGIVGYGLGGSR